MSETERFGFAFAPAYRVLAGVFGIRPKTAWVDMGRQALDVRFGPWRVSTPLANVTDVAVTGPYAFWKTAGPARLAITDRGLTFATSTALDREYLVHAANEPRPPCARSTRPLMGHARAIDDPFRRARRGLVVDEVMFGLAPS